ncbi:hypothetical protein [Deinococcus sp. QL22]|uniref:hypothetical protein n=1 Tax=Deinococcus sp. QL22 TaxID=2939437 RepID=UPI0020181BE5|nr:hypothetical protein [Deinococcus sp. QL22]UQN10610.1 hypothetical protein M1R55_30920 [Deinococcus sp. QL22]
MSQSLLLFEQALSLMTSRSLWPQFHPENTPYIVFDGQNTTLYHTPPPSHAWTRDANRLVFRGRHPSVTANTATVLENGVVAASLMLNGLPSDPKTLAAIAVHEAFHVFQQLNPSPAWESNELDAFTYPNDDEEMLALAVMEDEALTCALHDRHDWQTPAGEALEWRRRRQLSLHPQHLNYERAMERIEGLAHYVEVSFLDQCPRVEGDVLKVRQRAYGVGAAWAVLLDRTGLEWKLNLAEPSMSLDEVLAQRLAPRTVGEIPRAVHQRANESAMRVHRQRAQEVAAFEAQRGESVWIRASSKLWLRGFDPMNVIVLSGGQLLHRRYLRFGNDEIEGEVMGQACLSFSSSEPLLASGIDEIRVLGVEEVQVTEEGRQLEAPGLLLRSKQGRWCHEGGEWRYTAVVEASSSSGTPSRN